MGKISDITGQTFGKLTAIKFIGADKNRHSIWECACECSSICKVTLPNLKSGNTTSCGCHTSIRINDLSGLVFGRLTVIRQNGIDRHQKSLWLCKCECGNEVVCVAGNLNKGTTTSCGCTRSEMLVMRNRTHGMTTDPQYCNWKAMHNRVKFKKQYIARGITVCERYKIDYLAFKSDIGQYVPEKNTVDRIDNNGHYSCGKCDECKRNGWAFNVRWADMKEQGRNRSNTILLTYRGAEYSLAELAAIAKITHNRLYNRIFTWGWEVEEAVETPILTQYHSKKDQRLNNFANFLAKQ